MVSRVVLITGCSTGGIGYHLCEQFAARNCTVYATSRRTETIGDFLHPGVHKLALDVTNEEDVNEAICFILHKEGRVDIVVNCAAILEPLVDLELDQVKNVFDTNVYSALRIVKAVVPSMASRRSGLIINIGSIAGEVPTPWNGIYCASKAALHSLTECLSMELRPFNIDVMLVSPGAVKSNIANNQSRVFDILPKNTLYSGYLHNITDRLSASQGPASMPTDVFAKKVVSKALMKHPPGYLIAGGHVFLIKILKWLPRSLALWLMWRRFTQKR